MSDYISRETAAWFFRSTREHLRPQDYKSADEFNTRDLMLLNAEQAIRSMPSISVIDHARAIKEYCKDKGDDCTGCPFDNTNACELSRVMLPNEWFLPEEV